MMDNNMSQAMAFVILDGLKLATLITMYHSAKEKQPFAAIAYAAVTFLIILVQAYVLGLK